MLRELDTFAETFRVNEPAFRCTLNANYATYIDVLVFLKYLMRFMKLTFPGTFRFNLYGCLGCVKTNLKLTHLKQVFV